MKRRIEGLYAVTPEQADTAALSRLARAALAGGARVLQYRSKNTVPALRLAQARALYAVCAEFGATLIVNDDPELAAAADAGGVHLGRDDAGIERARALLGAGKIIGMSCYGDLSLARAAAAGGADYLAFGSVFASPSKPAAPAIGLGVLGEARRAFSLPIVAIGGITPDNAASVRAAGAHAIAVISALFDAPDVTAAARQFCQHFHSKNHDYA